LPRNLGPLFCAGGEASSPSPGSPGLPHEPEFLIVIVTAVPVFIVLYFLFLGVLALLAQMILPVIFAITFPALNVLGFGAALVPLVVIYASLELGDERAPLVAVLLGLILDLASSYRLGTSMLVLGSLSAMIATQAQRPEAHRWVFRMAFVLVGTFAYLLLDYILILAETARWTWPFDVWTKITFASLLNLVLSPIFFYLAGLPPRLCGWRAEHEKERRYAR
jgi:rod shape-determining protein MreD